VAAPVVTVPAGDPWATPAGAPASPAADPRATPTGPAYAPPESAGRETREAWDARGHLVRRLVFDGGVLQSETSVRHDTAGNAVEERTVVGESLVVQTWTYDTENRVTTHTVVADGATTLAERFAYAEGRLATRSVTTPDGGTSVTTLRYDPAGDPVLAETRSGAGALVARVVSDRALAPTAPTKLTVGVNAGVSTVSDVRTTSVSAGFSIARKPDPAVYETDPIELSAHGSYDRAESGGTRTNDLLKAGVGFDYNALFGPVTAFLFTEVERNPVANLDVDLVVAPIGLKYDIVPRGAFTLDASFAPVWNFRAIAVAAGEACDARTLAEDGHCVFSKIRGSFRVRAELGGATATLQDTLEFLPTLNPDGAFFAAIADEAIVRNTLALDVRLTGHLSLVETVVFVRDPLLAAQAACTADADNLLCRGLSLQTGTTLALAYAF